MGDKKKRVMILTSSHMIGGFETRSGIIIHGLDKERFEVTALLVYPLYKAKKTPEGIRRAQKKRLYWEGRGIKTVEIGMHNRYDVMAIVKTARIMRKLRIEILFFFALGSGTFLAPIAACCAGIPRIIRASGTVFEGLYPSVLRPLDRFLLHWTDMVVVPSQYLKALVRRKLHVPSGKLRIVPNGIDVRRFGNRSHRCGLKKELGLPASSRIVGIVANLIPVKDHAVLIRSAPRILESLPDVHFLLVGDGPLKDSLKLLSRQLDVEKHVQFLGYRPDVDRIISVMDVGVLCSQTETFSNALLEIMASGIPVVAPSVGAIPEIIDNEQTGLLVPQGDADALAAAVIRLLTSKVETLQYVKRARSAVTQKYSMDVMISKVEGVLDAF